MVCEKAASGTERKHYLDILRTIAILAVVLLHSASRFDGNVQPKQVLWYVAAALGVLTQFAVPVFVMVSGSLLLGRDTIDIKRLFTKNILRFLIAYLFWSFLYTVFYSIIPYYGAFSELAIKNLISGTLKGGFSHLWFMPLIIGLYMAAPVLNRCVRALDQRTLDYGMVVSVLFCFVLPTLRFIPLFDHVFGELIDHLRTGFWGVYLVYFLLGYVLDKTVIPEKMYKGICRLGAATAVVSVLALWIPSLCAGKLIDYVTANDTLTVLIMSVYVFTVVKKACAQGIAPWLQKACRFSSDMAFGIYLFHEFVINKVHQMFFADSQSVFAIPILFVVTTVVSCAVVLGIRKIKPIARYIT